MNPCLEVKGFPSFPRELVIEIFLHCLPDLSYHRPDPKDAPLLLTHVCSSWRTFASQITDLWQSISLGGVSASSDLMTQQQTMLHQFSLWETNARHRLLDVSLKTYGYTDKRTFWDDLMLLTVIKPSQRLRKLSLDLFLPHPDPIYALPSASFSSLESLQLTIDGHYLPTTEDREMTAFAHAPSLRKVILSIPNQMHLELPWAQLTHFELSPSKPFSFFRFIAATCPILQALSLTLNDHSEIEQLDPFKGEIVMKHLNKLSLTVEGGEDLSILSSTYLPSLRHFRLCNSVERDPTRLTHWTLPFSIRHNHVISQFRSLHSLALGYQKMDCDAVLEILRHTPLLVELNLDSELQNYVKFLKCLTYNPEADQKNFPVPKLEKFSLYVEINQLLGPAISFTAESFFDMIASRSSKVLPRSEGNLASDEKSDQPARLTHVFLCVEEAEEESQVINLEDLKSRTAHLSELESKIALTVDPSLHKARWLQNEVPMW